MAGPTLDVVIPIIFPDYKIKVSESVRVKIELDPVELFGVEVFDGFRYKGPEVFDGKVEDLGHAAVQGTPIGLPAVLNVPPVWPMP